jgi:hypothetical protein
MFATVGNGLGRALNLRFDLALVVLLVLLFSHSIIINHKVDSNSGNRKNANETDHKKGHQNGRKPTLHLIHFCSQQKIHQDQCSHSFYDWHRTWNYTRVVSSLA